MTTDMTSELARKQPAQIVSTSASNPHAVPAVITGIGLIATAVASAHSAATHPDLLNLVVSADFAALTLFLVNMCRYQSWTRP